MGVGQLIGKLFGGESEKGGALLRAYGKLPFYAEYRRLELAPGGPTAFSRWLDAGRLAWIRSREQADPGTTRASRLLIGSTDGKDAIVATVWPSRDNLGRHFPFAFFVVCPAGGLGADAVERWASARSIHAIFDALHTQVHALGSGGDFYRCFKGKTIPLRPDDLTERVRSLRQEAARINAADWVESLSLGKEISASDWFGGLLRRANRWKGRPEAAAELALTCPLARGYSWDAQVVLWLEWLGDLSKKLGRSPWVITPADESTNPARFSLLIRGLLENDYQLMTTDDAGYGFIEHLSQPPVGADTDSSAGADVPADSLLTWLKQHAP